MHAIIQTPSPKFSVSVDFYRKLDFKILSDSPYQVTDGKVVVEINPDSFARPGIKLIDKSWVDVVEKLKLSTSVLSLEGGGYLFADPSGAWIYLIESNVERVRNSDESFSVLGNYAGVSLESINMQHSIDVWGILGFKISMGGVEQGWVSLERDGVTISVMKPFSCPHLFFNPSLTYFNGGKNLPVIQKIREKGISISEEITAFNQEDIVDNIIIRDPGGYGFFIFND